MNEVNFESIKGWNGISDTGKDARLKLDRNFQKVKDQFDVTDVHFELVGEQLTQIAEDFGDLSSLIEEEKTARKAEDDKRTSVLNLDLFLPLAPGAFYTLDSAIVAVLGSTDTANLVVRSFEMRFRVSYSEIECWTFISGSKYDQSSWKKSIYADSLTAETQARIDGDGDVRDEFYAAIEVVEANQILLANQVLDDLNDERTNRFNDDNEIREDLAAEISTRKSEHTDLQGEMLYLATSARDELLAALEIEETARINADININNALSYKIGFGTYNLTLATLNSLFGDYGEFQVKLAEGELLNGANAFILKQFFTTGTPAIVTQYQIFDDKIYSRSGTGIYAMGDWKLISQDVNETTKMALSNSIGSVHPAAEQKPAEGVSRRYRFSGDGSCNFSNVFLELTDTVCEAPFPVLKDDELSVSFIADTYTYRYFPITTKEATLRYNADQAIINTIGEIGTVLDILNGDIEGNIDDIINEMEGV